jgi:hypothetical protein
VEFGAAGHRDGHQPTGIGMEDGIEHLVVRQPGLHEEAAAVGPGPEQSGRPRQQCQRLLVGAEPRGEQLRVDVEEGHDVGFSDPVEHRLGPDVDPRLRRRALVRADDLDDRAPGYGLELVP